MDGTLVDTEPFWIEAETELVQQFGGVWTFQDALQMVGKGLWVSAEILRDAGVDMSADDIVHFLTEQVRLKVRAQGAPWQPGARELLQEIRHAGLKTALVTMSIRSLAEEVVDQLGFDGFDLLVTGDEVTNPKPNPEPYLVALQHLGLTGDEAAAIEDSPPGVRSARDAGLVALGVPHAVPLDAAEADAVWSSLSGRSIGDLSHLHAEVVSRRKAV